MPFLEDLSRTLLWLTRHAAPSFDLTVLPGGWIKSDELFEKVPAFSRGQFKSVIKTVVEEAVKNDPETRLQVSDALADDSWQVRATTAHTFDITDDGTLYPDHVCSEAEKVVYLTRPGAFRRIQRAGSVNCMRRVHIHLVPIEHLWIVDAVQPGHTFTVAIEFNIEAAQKAENIIFLDGCNKKILTRGNVIGVLSMAYCNAVWVREENGAWTKYEKDSVPSLPDPVPFLKHRRQRVYRP
jgi:RNA:NAD 2'-phosphotransferase (TPT1/KptA family)